MIVNEIFISIQGEGFYLGEKSVFVRLAGCDLDCEWCDTKYAWDDSGEEYSTVDLSYDIIEMCHENKIDTVVITGGEPFYQREELVDLVNLLSERLKITIETHGGLSIPQEIMHTENVFLSISPKLSNAEVDYDERQLDKNILNINSAKFWNYQMKFVIDDVEEDVKEAKNLMVRTMLPEYPTVIFQPMAEKDDSLEDLLKKQKELTEYIINHEFSKFDVRVLPQLHKLIYGNKRGK